MMWKVKNYVFRARRSCTMSQWISGDVLINGVKIHYTRTGGEKPPVVLLHGFSDNGLCWTRVARALEGTYDVIMPDARGHGLSDGPDEKFSPEQRNDDVAGLITELHLGKPALVGHSMGAGMASSVAAEHPELVSCVILEDPGWRDPSPEQTSRPAGDMFQWIRRLKALSRDELVAVCHKESPTWVEEEVEPWADSKIEFNEDLLKGSPFGRSVPWREVAGRISCPALLITADPERGAIVTPEVAEEVATLWPDDRVVHIAGAGHNIRREQYALFIGAVVAFLQEVYLPTAVR
jgi:pimeloyl-ACP methyl ester carboxylesterase